jgi:hypothetical protein
MQPAPIDTPLFQGDPKARINTPAWIQWLVQLVARPVYAVYVDNAAALAGGLMVGDQYRTATGQVMVVF